MIVKLTELLRALAAVTALAIILILLFRQNSRTTLRDKGTAASAQAAVPRGRRPPKALAGGLKTSARCKYTHWQSCLLAGIHPSNRR